MSHYREGEQDEGGRDQGEGQSEDEEPITIQTEIEVDWLKKRGPEKESTDTEGQSEKK
jgi:hypothetical protein